MFVFHNITSAYECFIECSVIGSGMSVPYWDFQGSTMVTKNYIRLTPDSQSTQGALWNSVVSVCKLEISNIFCKKII